MVSACEFRAAGRWPIYIVAGETGLLCLGFGPLPAGVNREDGHPLLVEARRQLEAYFAGRLRDFDLPLQLPGTDFQRRVWEALRAIPYGETRSYGELARAIGRPRAFRAVGQANHDNPVAIVIPCHRVVASGGGLGGYGGGLELKRFLLDLERTVTASRNSSARSTSMPMFE